MKIYCDTDTLLNNIRSEPTEEQAITTLALAHREGKIVLHGSNINRVEVMATPDATLRERLVADHDQREPVPKQERLLRFNSQGDQFTWICSPVMSDVQDDALCQELQQHGLAWRDAQHITQAVCNDCDVFLTRDKRTILKPHRGWLETRFPTLKFRLPSELVAELGL